jgi:hypothetical protein
LASQPFFNKPPSRRRYEWAFLMRRALGAQELFDHESFGNAAFKDANRFSDLIGGWRVARRNHAGQHILKPSCIVDRTAGRSYCESDIGSRNTGRLVPRPERIIVLRGQLAAC